MSSSDSENSDDNLDGAVCEQLCQEFAAITGTDSALAMYFLQNSEWELQNALNKFFEEMDTTDGPFILGDKSEVFKKPETTGGDTSAGPVKVTALTFGAAAGVNEAKNDPESAEGPSPQVDPEPTRFRLLSWNIDGLDTNNIQCRTKAVCQLILKENPDVVFLQEVVPMTLRLIKESLSHYLIIPADDMGYFTAILLRRITVTCESHEIIPFYSSKMGRNLLSVEATIKKKPMLLMTSHLESTKPHEKERVSQLKRAFKLMSEADTKRTVIFGGDLNLRDKELQSIGGPQKGIHDLWELTGKRKIAEFTWDQQKNDNLGMESKFKPRMRFDRLYIRHSAASGPESPNWREPSNKDIFVKPVYFELVGLERVEPCKRFPSDHWGILTHYDLQ